MQTSLIIVPIPKNLKLYKNKPPFYIDFRGLTLKSKSNKLCSHASYVNTRWHTYDVYNLYHQLHTGEKRVMQNALSMICEYTTFHLRNAARLFISISCGCESKSAARTCSMQMCT